MATHKKQAKHWLLKYTQRLRRSVWFFPIVLLLPLVIFTSLRISGSSVGVYHEILYGNQSHDENLIFGKPRPIRSDEWLVTTQLTIAQDKEEFPRVNQNLGSGKDISVLGSIPYKDWSTFFKPENWSFLIMPLDHAFAFKWWFMLYLLIVSCYFFTLRIIKGRKLFAVLFSCAIGLSPFVFWWYSNVTLLSIAYAFLILILGIRAIDNEPIQFLDKYKTLYTKIAYTLALAYVMTAFGLILYPPFQIPIAIVVGFFLLGYLFERKLHSNSGREWLIQKVMVLGGAVVVTASILGLFVITRSEAIHALTHTAYPGKRIVTSGHINPLNIFDSFLQPQLQSDYRGAHFFDNQSEASNFILLSPFLILPSLFLSYFEYKKKKRLDWLFVGIQACVLLFFARVFLPIGSSFYKLLFLGSVPHTRLLIGIGFANILLTLLVLRKISDLKLTTNTARLFAGIYTVICLAIVLAIGFYVAYKFPLFISYPPKIILLAICFSAIIFLILTHRVLLAAVFLFSFSALSVIEVHPLYKGLGLVENNNVIQHIQADSSANSKWAAADNLVFENFGLLSDRSSISGVQPYPELKIWKQADPNAEKTYNRYAHVVFISNPKFTSPLYLVQPDVFEVGLNCTGFITSNVDFVLDNSPINSPCLVLKDKISYPAIDFYIYKVNP